MGTVGEKHVGPAPLRAGWPRAAGRSQWGSTHSAMGRVQARPAPPSEQHVASERGARGSPTQLLPAPRALQRPRCSRWQRHAAWWGWVGAAAAATSRSHRC